MNSQTKYRTEYPARVRELIAAGCIDDRKIAKALGVYKDTLWRWTEKHEDFAAAMAGVVRSLPKSQVKLAKLEERARAIVAAIREGRAALKN